MVVAIDKATAVRMYDKVQKHWKMRLAELAADVETCDPLDQPDLAARLAFMQQTDMAVVVSQGQNEVDEMKQKGLDIRLHRERMVKEDLATCFKDADDPFRIVFVCAMWMTGFDVPSCGTIYLDKPMRNHTLMQTIARANRVFGEKVAGLIVDYIGIFRDLQRALAIYGSSTDGGTQPGETPVKEKDELVAELETAIADCRAFMTAAGVDLDAIHASEGFQRIKLLDDAEDALLVNDETKNNYLGLANNVDRLFHAILPDKAANRFGPDRKAIVVIADKIRSETPAADISDVMEAVENLLDQSIAPKGYIIRPAAQMLHSVAEKPAHWLDLSQLDFDALRKHFENSRKHVEAEKLRGQVNAKLARLMRLNKTRADYAAQLQRLIDDYNAGRSNVDEFFAQLVSLAQNLNTEEKRGISEQLSEEELAVFDLLTRPNLKLSRKEQAQVKQVAKELLDTLKAERLVLDWRKRQQARAAVQLTIEQVLDKLPEAFTPELYGEKCEVVYQHVYDSYYGAGKSLYGIKPSGNLEERLIRQNILRQ
jgi:type I restriction enzyme R subunit